MGSDVVYVYTGWRWSLMGWFTYMLENSERDVDAYLSTKKLKKIKKSY